MFHFFADQSQIDESVITITGDDVNHIKNVLRMKPGEQALISNRVDRDYLCEITELTGASVLFRIIEEMKESTELPARITLFQCLPKGDKMELIIQKAVELGVYRIVPVAARRCVVKLDAKKEAARLKRWNLIAESAAKQSKRVVIPEVLPVMGFSEAVAAMKELDKAFIPYECARGIEGSRQQISSVGPGMSIGVIIGPEGGFEEDEAASAVEAGAAEITLGRRILRTETAGLCILSILMFQLEN